MNKSMTRLVVALIAFLLVAVVAVPIVQGVINNKQSTDIGGGKDGKDGEDGITPQLRINYSTNEWEYSYTQGVTWQSLGVKATGAAGKDGINGTNGTDGKDGQDGQDGKDGTNGKDGKDGVSPRIRINSATSEWEISTDEGLTWETTGVKASGEVTASLTIDSELSETSENPVQNKVIMAQLMAYAAEVNTAFEEIWAALDNVSVTVPTFDLVAMGLPACTIGGSPVMIEADTTEIINALNKGPVKFIVGVDDNEQTVNFEVVLTGVFVDGMFMCQHVVDFIGGHPFLANVIVMEGVVGATVYDLNQGDTSVLPDVTTDDDGKGLIVQDGEWVVGELPETPTQEKTIEITESGTYEITPDAGYALSKVLATVNVPTSGNSGEETKNYKYKTGFIDRGQATNGAMTIDHGLGEVPDIVIFFLHDTYKGTENCLILASGYSQAMLTALGGGYLNKINITMHGTDILSFSSNVGIEFPPSTSWSGACLRNATSTEFTVGNDTYPISSQYGYTWIAISGIC